MFFGHSENVVELPDISVILPTTQPLIRGLWRSAVQRHIARLFFLKKMFGRQNFDFSAFKILLRVN